MTPLPLKAIMAEVKPRSLIYVSAERIDMECKEAPDLIMDRLNPDQVLAEDFYQRVDLIFIDSSMNRFNADRVNPLLAKCRDLLSPRVLIAHQPSVHLPLREQDFLALGFKHCAVTTQDKQQTDYYFFDIKTYKPVPDWLNPKFWANPELWDQYRW